MVQIDYNLGEFRKNLREAFNKAEAGEVVIIDRYGKLYTLSATGASVLKTDEVSSDVRSDISVLDTRGREYSKNIEIDTSGHIRPRQGFSKNSFPQAEDTSGFVEAGRPLADESGELPCCKLPKPCKHWQWDGVEQAYVNSLSGRSKAV